MDYTTLSEEQFEQHREALMTELERRNKLKDAPNQVKAIALDYQAMGGDKNVLVEAMMKEDE